MKKIKLSNGGETLVDSSQYGHLVRFKWYVDSNGYVARHDKGRGVSTYYMHRWIMGEPKKLVVDHINGNKLDNRLKNLRLCYQKNNSWNRSGWKKKMYSQYKGVTMDKRKTNKKYIAYIMHDRKQETLGYFDNEVLAAKAYNKAARKYFGEYALLNEINKGE